jgi:hypothetical protein
MIPAKPRTIPDEMMDLISAAFDAAWEASMAWNRRMHWGPSWDRFLEEHGLTECYADWKRRQDEGEG